MPFGAVFTSSAGGDIGGGRLRTRFRGPIMAGYASTGDPGAQTLIAAGGSPAGSAASPMYSFYTRPDMGLYGQNVTTSVPDMRMAQGGLDVWSWSSAQIGLFGSSQASAVPLVGAAGLMAGSSAAGSGALAGGLYIPQTTYGMTSSSSPNVGTTPPLINSGAIMVFDSARSKISIYSSVKGDWLSVTLTSS